MRRILVLFLVLGFVLTGGFVTACGDGESTPGGTGGTGGIEGGDAGGADGGQCYSATFTAPQDGAQLTQADDLDKNCSNGFTIDVTASVIAPDGTTAQLMSNGAQLASGTVSGNSVTFSGVQLNTGASTTVTLQVGDNANCTVTATYTVTCGPSCSISKPVLSATHPALNGVPASQGGDRVSADGTPYQAAFEVTTNIEDGQPVSISVDGSTVLTTVNASGGKAEFPGVTLTPDGDHTVVATCTAANGQKGTSASETFPVDSTPPDLTITGPKDGQFFGPSDDVDPSTPGVQFKVCGTTTSTDALDLSSNLGNAQNNYCVGIGTATPDCTPAVSGGTEGGTGGGACVTVTCPGGAPFDLNVTLTDAAGNPTTQTIQGVSCASSLPSVEIVEPVDGTGTDVNTHILNASMTTQRVDQDANTPGAQYTVTACTDTQNGSAQLMVGHAGNPLSPLGSPVTVVAAAASDNCPTGLGYVAKFPGVTLPESVEALDGSLTTATEIAVKVTAPSTASNTSSPVDVWVDTSLPTLGAYLPNPLCGAQITSTTDTTKDIVLASSVAPLTLSVTNSNGTQTYTSPNTLLNGRLDFGQVALALGDNNLATTSTEPSGNTTSLPSPCTVTVGNPPVVTWTAPSASTPMNASTDGDSATAGWQGTLTVHTDVGGSGGTVQFAYQTGATPTNLGTPVAIDASGNATLPGQTIPEGDPVKLIATTSDIPNRGVGTATLSKTVDVTVPGAITGLTPTVKDRRQTSFHLAWTAPSDGGNAVYGYDVRVSRAAITSANFATATVVPYTGSPAAPGQADGVDVTNREIETNNYFAVRAKDKAGNLGPIASAGPSMATFNVTTLSPGITNEAFGIHVDGSASINGDAYSDLLVSTENGNKAYVYFGGPNGYTNTPDVTFSGSNLFGAMAVVVGDIDSDGLPDVAIGAPQENAVYIFRGRATWPATLTSSQADYVIQADTAADAGFSGAYFGISIAPLGDFNGDGVDDFAVGGPYYKNGGTALNGIVAVVLGVKQGTTFPAVSQLPEAFGTRAIGIKGDTAFAGQFGATVLGMGKYYSTPGNTLIVGAPRAPSGANANAGRIYAFRGQTGGAGGVIDATAADNTGDGSAAGLRYGSTLALLGNVYGTSAPDLGIGAPALFRTGGEAILQFGDPSVGPFGGTTATLTDSAATTANDAFGYAVIGGGFSGSAVTTSFFDDGGPDVVVAPLTEGGGASTLYFLSTQAAGSVSGKTADVRSVATFSYPMPSNWLGVSLGSGGIKDLNGDGYGDIAIGEVHFVATPDYPGRVMVLW